MVSGAGDDPRAAGRALLMQVINAGDSDVGSGGGVDAGGRRLHQRQPHRVAPQQHQTHPGLVYLDLEPKHLTQERGGGRKIVNLQIGAAAQELDHRLMLGHPGRPSARIAAVRHSLPAREAFHEADPEQIFGLLCPEQASRRPLSRKRWG